MEHHIHGTDPEHGPIHIVAMEHVIMIVVPQFLYCKERSLLFSCKYSPAATRKPAVPAAGSAIMSVGVGLTNSTIILDNMPWCPELAISTRGG